LKLVELKSAPNSC